MKSKLQSNLKLINKPELSIRSIIIAMCLILTSIMAFLLGCQPENTVTQAEVSKEEDVKPELAEKEENFYEIQLMASTNLTKLENEQKKLKEFGYQTSISNTIQQGKKFYRLRLQDHFNYADAKVLGELLQEEFETIQDVWIQKIK